MIKRTRMQHKKKYDKSKRILEKRNGKITCIETSLPSTMILFLINRIPAVAL